MKTKNPGYFIYSVISQHMLFPASQRKTAYMTAL